MARRAIRALPSMRRKPCRFVVDAVQPGRRCPMNHTIHRGQVPIGGGYSSAAQTGVYATVSAPDLETGIPAWRTRVVNTSSSVAIAIAYVTCVPGTSATVNPE
jgi:hypothetical protein